MHGETLSQHCGLVLLGLDGRAFLLRLLRLVFTTRPTCENDAFFILYSDGCRTVLASHKYLQFRGSSRLSCVAWGILRTGTRDPEVWCFRTSPAGDRLVVHVDAFGLGIK